MGFDSKWPQIWGQKSDLFVVSRVECRTIFIDAQIQLMKSFVKENEDSWLQFVQRTFFVPIAEFHRRYDTVIVCFDNYGNVPVFKSIEQNRRVAGGSAFKFKAGDTLPSRPCNSEIWKQALLNRSFKSNIISLITSLMATEYVPPRRGTTLVIDFVNSTRIDYKTKGQTRVILEEMKAMGESDVKFMRYIPLFGDMCVDSIDSDVLLIAALFVARNAYAGNLYVRRYKTRLPPAVSAGKKRKLAAEAQGKTPVVTPERKKLEYEIIHVNLLLKVLQARMHEFSATLEPLKNGPEKGQEGEIASCEAPDTAHLTAMLSFLVLLSGSDYSRKLPRIGAKSLWDNMDIIVPAMQVCTSYQDNIFKVHEERTMNLLLATLYARIFPKHAMLSVVTTAPLHAGRLENVLFQLQRSQLSAKTKLDLPTVQSLTTMLHNIEWVVNYWAVENGDPICPVDGSCGFKLENNRVVFSDAHC